MLMTREGRRGKVTLLRRRLLTFSYFRPDSRLKHNAE